MTASTPLTRSLLLLLALGLGAAQAENWPQWRGPNNDGVSHEKGVPTEWGAEKNVAWKLAMPGEGCSTPAVWGDRLFLTAQSGKRVVLWCVSTAGKKLWEKDLGAATRWARSDEGNGATASPSTDGKRVYVFAGSGDFAAFDFDGKEAWRFNAQERYGKFRIQFGVHSTPVLHGDRLYQQIIHEGGGLVVCLDKNTGKEVWKLDRKSDGTDENEHSYASAFIWQKGKGDPAAYLVIHGNDYATGHDLNDGKEIWRVGDLNPKASYNRFLRFVASPVCTPDLIVIPTAKNGPVVGLKPDAKGEVNKGSNFEQWRINKGTPDVPSPLVHDGLVYLSGEMGALTCLDAKTGQQVYRKQVGKGRHRANPVYADGKVYLTARNGVVNVVQAGKEYKLLATNKLPDDLAASPAVSGGRVYLHGFKHLWAIEEKK